MDKVNLGVDFAGVKMKNPITVASGTFGSGMEYSEYTDLNLLGAVTTKGVSRVPWEGNPTPRVTETYGGMLNAIGLQNPGTDIFKERDIPFLQQFDTNIIVNVCGHSKEEYLEAVEALNDEPVDMFEINISCPNVKEGGITFGTVPEKIFEVTESIKKISKKPIIMKLTPNVTDIKETAKAAEAGGADALSLINTLTGMKIDVDRRKFALANKTGGLSGPAIMPVAVRMVYEVSHTVNIPVLGMGGVRNYRDALEFIMAGATMVAVGTYNFIKQDATCDIVKGLEEYLIKNNISDINELIGCVD
ncbi:MAG: dihydroorotate dehydrogenase [Lachnospiraceae bacterium]|nr:dihydroorotate dehydrogenase [Lachnospiraceae bacterium]